MLRLNKYYHSLNNNTKLISTIYKKFNKTLSKNFILYIPEKQLTFQNHPKHGKVVPVYIADEEYNTKNNPKKITPYIKIFSIINIFLFLSGLQIIPATKIYTFLWVNENIILASIGLNIYFIKKYFSYLVQYHKRVKNMYLNETGNGVIIESFDGEINKVEIADIYERNINNKYENKKNIDNVWINNDNNFHTVIKWGRAKENYFTGKRIYLDYELFKYIVGRTNVDTQQTKFKEEIPLNIYSTEDKRKVYKYLKSKNEIEKLRIDFNESFSNAYYRLKKRFNK
jgi:hypothetical protein